MGEGKETPLNELLTNSLVTINVGQSSTPYHIHEALLCARSSFFAKTFSNSSSSSKSHSLPDEEPESFNAFVSWLYSAHTPTPSKEADLDVLYDLYLLGSKLRAKSLQTQTMNQIKHFYKDTDTYPGLRRVQYVYANTDEGSSMRGVLVSAVARGLVLRGDGIPLHWDKALRKNGSLAVDLVRAVQGWGLSPERIPDARSEEEAVNIKDDDEEEEEEDEELEEEDAPQDEAAEEADGEAEEEVDGKQEDAEEKVDGKQEDATREVDGKQGDAEEQVDGKQGDAEEQVDGKQADAEEQVDGKQADAEEKVDGKQEDAEEAGGDVKGGDVKKEKLQGKSRNGLVNGVH